MVQAPPPEPGVSETILHATCVEADGHGLLILGGSGSGKSTLALDLIGLGARLVADDRTILRAREGGLVASPPEVLEGRIEARHVGLLRLPFTARARVGLAIDLDRIERHRLPPRRNVTILGQTVTLLYRPPGVHSASALLQCLRMRRTDP